MILDLVVVELVLAGAAFRAAPARSRPALVLLAAAAVLLTLVDFRWPYVAAAALLGAAAGLLPRRPRAAAVFGLAVFVAQEAAPALELPLAWRPFALPGKAFLLMRWLHLCLEASEGAAPGRPLERAAYLFFPPTLVAGPWQRYAEFRDQLSRPGAPPWGEVYEGARRAVLGGLSLRAGELLWTLSMPAVFDADLAALGRGRILLAAALFGPALFLMFAGASASAIGLSAFFGVRPLENFDRPWLSRNPREYWSRWHMSFAAWIFDHVLLPLRRLLPTVPAVAAMFALSGLWHGLTLSFLYYGLYHGAGFLLWQAGRAAGARAFGPEALRAADESLLARIAARVLLFCFVTGSWFFFLDYPLSLRALLTP